MTSPLVEQLERLFSADALGAVAVYLFGSEARGEAGPASDVDLAILFEQPPTPTLLGGALEIEGALERQLRRPVDLVVLNTAPADVVHRVLRDGVLVLDRDRAARIRFEVQRRNEFFDLQPLRDRYRRAGAGEAAR